MVDSTNELTKEHQGIEDVELAVSKLLRIGVLISGTIITIGLILFLVTGKSGYPGHSFPTRFGDILHGLFALKSYAIILTGLFLLILTPVFRVFVSIFVFWKEKDKLYVVITIIVFIILMISLALGKAG
ncbi:DUF1634 domain-containing protein [Bacillus sp. RG28]|uniref:DUF1634 domain-containing protein n=1 Tax=Gottfriedia endophytica TaxID=2820819 RepID=A0A940SKU4_9BACI|nr:DUF1634 domain-containing protein [Gottfriedia endophytica]MBP0725628.1 DUF1634 domain-containing protein [Gottfriedia endophytica]